MEHETVWLVLIPKLIPDDNGRPEIHSIWGGDQARKIASGLVAEFRKESGVSAWCEEVSFKYIVPKVLFVHYGGSGGTY